MSSADRPNWIKIPASFFDARVCLGLILVIGVIVRLIALGGHTFTQDELVTIRFAGLTLAEIIAEIIAWENHPPLYYFLLYFMTRLFGESEIAIRLPSVLFSVLSVYFTYKVGRLLFNRYVGLTGAFLLALSPFSVYYAQEGRMYSLLALTSLISLYLLLRWSKEQTTKLLLLYGLSTVALVYTHIFGLFILFAENLYFATMLLLSDGGLDRTRLKNWIVCQFLIVASASPWLAILIRRTTELQETGFWVSVPTISTLTDAFSKYAGDAEARALWALLFCMGLLSAVRSGQGESKTRWDDKQAHGIFVTSMFLLVVNVIPFLISMFVTPMYLTRYTIGAYSGFVLLVAAGTERLGQYYFRVVALMLLALFSLDGLYGDRNIHSYRAEQRQAVEYLEQRIQQDDAIILCGDRQFVLPFKHYAAKEKLGNRILVVESGRIETTKPQIHRAWFVRMNGQTEGCEDVDSVLSAAYSSVESRRNFHGMELLFVEKLPASNAEE